jgi:hypothetical protein
VADLLVSTGSLGAAREVAVGVERGTRYELIGPDGARVVFNDRTDIDFVGFLTEVPSGIDSPEVRESADILVEADGGIHGSFYFGRRPFTLTGMIDPTPNVGRDTVVEAGITRLMQAGEVVNRRINRLQRATRAMTGDSLLRWQAAAAATDRELRYRRQDVPCRDGRRRPAHPAPERLDGLPRRRPRDRYDVRGLRRQ